MKFIYCWRFLYFQVVSVFSKAKFYLKNQILRTIENYFDHVLYGFVYQLSNFVSLRMARKQGRGQK